MRLRHYMHRGETRMSMAFVTITLHFTCFYMFLPTKIDRASFRHGDQNHITMVRVVTSAREIGYAKQMKRHFS